MLRMRLKPVGRKHDRSYRIVIQQKRQSPQSGRYVERIGAYDPRSDEITLEADRAEYWLDEGVQPTDTVHNILIKEGILDADAINPLPQKSPVVNEEEGADETEADEDEESSEEDEENEGESTDTADDEEAEEEASEEESDDEGDGQSEDSAKKDEDDADEEDDEEAEEKDE